MKEIDLGGPRNALDRHPIVSESDGVDTKEWEKHPRMAESCMG